VGEFGDDGRLVGFSNIESLHCLLPKPGLAAGFSVEARSWTRSWTASFGPLLLVDSCVGEFRDDGRLVLPKLGLEAGFLVQAKFLTGS
jgi:roadblock/LC7 domain-containing protein